MSSETTVNEKPAGKPRELAARESNELKERAFKLFEVRTGHHTGLNIREVARRSFLDAKAFMEFAEEVETGTPLETEADKDIGLDDGCAPNLGAGHPINLKSRRFGNEKTLARYRELEKDPVKYALACKNNQAPDKVNTPE